MHRLTILASVTLLVGMAATAAWSLTLGVELTPKALSANHRSFTITTRGVGELKEITVVMTADRDGPVLSPFVHGDLSLSTPTDLSLSTLAPQHLALVRLEPLRQGRQIRFWFRLSPEAIAGSRLDIDESAYDFERSGDGTPLTDDHGQPKYRQLMGGWRYGFHLRDFVGPDAAKR
jgi:hypothetical protein